MAVTETRRAGSASPRTAKLAAVLRALRSGGTAVGGGFVSGGTILRGARGFAGEVGHIAVDPSGERCPCGRTGCLETKANLAAVLRAAAGPGDPLHDPAPGVEGRVALLKDRIRLPAGGDGGPRTRRGVRARPACPLRGAAHLAAPLPAQAAPSAGEVCA